MKIQLNRYSDNGQSTQGLMFLVNQQALNFMNYTLEDESREIKIKGETCIPEGLYEVGFNENVTPMTKKYRKKFSWFTYHLHIKNVPGFEWIYIHVGNTEKDSDGCVLVQDQANNNQIENGFNGSSTSAYTRLYTMVADAVMNGEKVFIEIRDIKHLA